MNTSQKEDKTIDWYSLRKLSLITVSLIMLLALAACGGAASKTTEDASDVAEAVPTAVEQATQPTDVPPTEAPPTEGCYPH
ncbi:MAG: hypothetical protein R3C44_14720 [Chloroflexota bacterium]